MKRFTPVAALLLLAVASTASAQQAHTHEKASNAAAATMSMTGIYNMAKANILKSADQMPDDKYSYKPTPAVRSFGALLAHIADAQNFFCAMISGSPKQYADVVEKGAQTKAALQQALKDSFAACDAALAGVTDAQLANGVNIFGNKSTISGAITLLSSHNWEHYGNLVTYMRMNNMVPPSSQGM